MSDCWYNRLIRKVLLPAMLVSGTPQPATVSGSADTLVTVALSPLQPNSVYYVRATATGGTPSSTTTFTTLGATTRPVTSS